MRTVPGLLWAVRPELPVSACRLWQLALMLHAAGVGAFGTQGLHGARATARSADNRGLRGDLDRRLFGAVPVVNQNVVCPPPCFFGRLCRLPLYHASRALPVVWSRVRK